MGDQARDAPRRCCRQRARKLLAGDGERDAMEDDISFTAPSQTTFVSQHLVFAAILADAAMVYEFVMQAIHRVPRGREGGRNRGAVVGRS